MTSPTIQQVKEAILDAAIEATTVVERLHKAYRYLRISLTLHHIHMSGYEARLTCELYPGPLERQERAMQILGDNVQRVAFGPAVGLCADLASSQKELTRIAEALHRLAEYPRMAAKIDYMQGAPQVRFTLEY